MEGKGKKALCPYCNLTLGSGYDCSNCGKNWRKEFIENRIGGSLTDQQIDAQDHVDNLCFNLIKEFVPNCDWDIAKISVVRDALVKVLTEFGFKEYDIYPWYLETEEDNDATVKTIKKAMKGYGQRR